MDSNISKILRENYVDGVFHTHVSLIRPKGKFQFNRETMEKFWEAYCDYLDHSENPVVGIAEKSQEYLPVLADIDIRVRDEGDIIGEKLYKSKQLKSVVEIYQSVIRQIVEGCTEEDLICVVLEKNMYTQTKNDISYLKHGFHLHFPYCFLSKKVQESQIIPRVQQSVRELELFNNLGIEDSGSVIDTSCCNVPWLVYGSRKNDYSEAYKVTKIYNSEMQKLSLKDAFRKYQLYNHKERLINIRGKESYYLPRILSIIPYGRPTKELKRGIISPLKEKNPRKERKSSTHYRKMSSDEALKIARELMPLLASFRAEDYNEWITIGWVLYNISDGDIEGRDIWCDFSAQCEEKYDENSCLYEWDRMTKRELTLGTLKYYASIDSPEEYKKYKNAQAKKHIKNSLEGSHNDIAKALYAEYGDEFVCASVSNRLWFQFINHRWEQIEEGIFLRQKISGRIVDKYINAVKEMYDELRDETDKTKQQMISARIKTIGKMVSSLKNANYKNNVMKECVEVFYDPRFRERLDTNPFIIAFKNGVYDLKLNIFRPGRPEDFLSKNLPIEYHEYKEDDQEVLDVHTFLEQIFPDKNVRKYFLDTSAHVFVGGNFEKIVIFWTGEGDNGKSVTQKFFELMLGKLCIKLNTNILTGKKPSAGSAFADLARAGGGVRWAVLEEPNGDEAINVGTLKYLTGNDSFYARDLFEKGKDGREIVPMFKLVFVCNKLPRMKYADKAVWNRVRVLPFESTFCRPNDPAPESYEEQLIQKRFPMDKNFTKKIPKLVPAFAWILLQHRKTNTTCIEPEKVRIATDVYRRQNDIYKQFIDECVKEDKTKYISLTELYGMFKEWFRDSLPGQSIPIKNEVKDYFVRLWGEADVGMKWKGFRQRTLQDDIESGDAIYIPPEELEENQKNYNKENEDNEVSDDYDVIVIDDEDNEDDEDDESDVELPI